MKAKKKPELIMMIGLPGSGKSTLAKQFGYKIHSSDEIRRELNGDLNDQSNPETIFRLLHKRIKSDLANGISCVYDATNISRKRRIAFLQELGKTPVKKTAMLVLTSVKKCLERNSMRLEQDGSRVPDEAIERMLRSFELPYWYEGWNDIRIVVNDESELSDLRLSNPECWHELAHDNPHHTKSIGDHMLAAEEYAKTHGLSDEICEAARYHDCGKPHAKRFIDTHGHPTDIAHYYGHENIGAYMYLRSSISKEANVKKGHDASVLYVAQLINWHMKPMIAWMTSHKTAERDRHLMGDAMFFDICLVHEADIHTD